MKYRYQSGSMVYEVFVERRGAGYRMTINGEDYDVDLLDAQPGALSLRLAGPHGALDGAAAGVDQAAAFRPHVIYWGAGGDAGQPWPLWLSAEGCTYRLERPAPRRARAAAGGPAEDEVRAPMPAQVRAVQVAEGEAVAAGQTLLLLEAMKMEIRVQAPRAGRVARLLAKPGETVERDQVIVELAARAGDEPEPDDR